VTPYRAEGRGVHLPNARELLFDAAERVLRRDGASGLTSGAVTAEGAARFPLISEGSAAITAYLTAEQALGRWLTLPALQHSLPR
jgi:hypothetical protein